MSILKPMILACVGVTALGGCGGGYSYPGCCLEDGEVSESGGPALLYRGSAWEIDVPGVVSVRFEEADPEEVWTRLLSRDEPMQPFEATATWASTLVVHDRGHVREHPARARVSVTCGGEGATEANPCGEPVYGVPGSRYPEPSMRVVYRAPSPGVLEVRAQATFDEDGWVRGETQVNGGVVQEFSVRQSEAVADPDLWGWDEEG